MHIQMKMCACESFFNCNKLNQSSKNEALDISAAIIRRTIEAWVYCNKNCMENKIELKCV